MSRYVVVTRRSFVGNHYSIFDAVDKCMLTDNNDPDGPVIEFVSKAEAGLVVDALTKADGERE
jgi:hypothetical protein